MLGMKTETIIAILLVLTPLLGFLIVRRRTRLSREPSQRRLAWLLKAAPNSRFAPQTVFVRPD